MKTKYLLQTFALTIVSAHFAFRACADSLINSWITDSSSQYVRLYTNNAAKLNDRSSTTWTISSVDGTNVSNSQALPVYAGVQAIYSSSNWVYIRSSGMPGQTLGPLGAYSPAPLILPTNQHNLFRFPRTQTVPTTKITTPGGAIGFMVDGAQMFDIRDALSWTGSSEGMGTGYWTRDAYVNEGYGFDPVFGHSAPGGGYHYHANPLGLRYRLVDNIDFNPTTKIYSQSTNAPTKHSPILGWVSDGSPVYGPYGYANATNANSGIRRMISGFVLRDGSHGTANLVVTGRTNIPPWAQRIYNTNNVTGPSNFSSYPLGRYLEDHDWMGDIINPNTGTNFIYGTDYDLDIYNGRWCVTPEFPNGTYAYFVTINSDGSPAFPYYIGRAYYGSPTGGNVSTINEAVTTNFLGGTNTIANLKPPQSNSGNITVTWSAVEGGTYRVESSTNLSTWTTNATSVAPAISTATYADNSPDAMRFYRVALAQVATNDSVFGGSTGGGGVTPSGTIVSLSPTSHTANNTAFTLTITLDSTAPPAGAPVTSVTLGSISGTSITHTSQTIVTCSITIPTGTSTGPKTVTVTFSPPPGQQSGPTYTLANGFTIN
jgi:hypothetical protein